VGHIKKYLLRHTDTNICSAMMNSTKHKHRNKNWAPKVQKLLYKLNVARSTVFKNKPLNVY
jgi:hypothetical protein